MKNKKYILFVALAILFIPLACSRSFLDPASTSGASQAVLFHTPQDGISLVNAIYDGFDFDNHDFVLKALWYNANYCSQDYFNWGADVSYNTFEFPTDFASTAVFWNLSYQGIARANSAIPIIAQMHTQGVLTDSLANFLTGQAYFLRGVFYYYMACTFGGVPLELKTVTGSGLDPRSSQDSVFQSVINDMETAAPLLPWPESLPASDLGRATRGAALSYMGAAQMWRKQYDSAILNFKQVIPHYSLIPNYLLKDEYNMQNNAESIFELQFQLPGGETANWNYNNNMVTWMSSFMWPWETSNFGYTYASPLLEASFEPGDLRKQATVVGPNDTLVSPGILNVWGGIKGYPQVQEGFAGQLSLPASHFTAAGGGIINTCGKTGDLWTGDQPGQPRSGYYGVKQWRDPHVTGNTPNPHDNGNTDIFGDQNVCLMRLGEIYLDLAECQGQSGDMTDAMANLQIVRNRAWGTLTGGPVAPAPTGASFLDMMDREYRHELSGEVSLYYDLRRNGTHLTYLQTYFNITVPAGHDLLPIPQTAIASNPTLTQNPGY
jgi:starch-binding outer membrane protein, SusD/RagB family